MAVTLFFIRVCCRSLCGSPKVKTFRYMDDMLLIDAVKESQIEVVILAALIADSPPAYFSQSRSFQNSQVIRVVLHIKQIRIP
jgi:hypothetical protein